MLTEDNALSAYVVPRNGSVPVAEVRAFLADDRPYKRARKIDELLSRPEYAAFWATRFSDWTGNDTRYLANPYRPQQSKQWHDWFRDKLVAEGMIHREDLELVQLIDQPEEVVDAIFKHYETRGFLPLPEEHELMLNL